MTLEIGTLTAELAPAGTGINQAVRSVVRLAQGDVEAYVKRLSDPREIVVECVAALMGRNLGLPIPAPILVFVPPALNGPSLAFGSMAVGSPDLSYFVSGGTSRAVAERLKKWPSLVPSGCFDEWIANCDRHDRNLLHDGLDRFWLIDHGLAVHAHFDPCSQIHTNKLLDFLVSGESEEALQNHLRAVIQAMSEYARVELSETSMADLRNLIGDHHPDQILGWLTARQPHLVRLGSARIPALQRDILEGGER